VFAGQQYGAEVRNGSNTANGQLFGTNASYQDVQQNFPKSGRFLTDSDNASRRRVAVLGEQMRRDLKLPEHSAGQFIQIGSEWFKVVGVMETNMGLGSVSSGGVLYAEVCAALYESPRRPLVVSFMAGMGGEAIVLKEFYWMTQKMLDAQKRGAIEKRTHWVGFEE